MNNQKQRTVHPSESFKWIFIAKNLHWQYLTLSELSGWTKTNSSTLQKWSNRHTLSQKQLPTFALNDFYFFWHCRYRRTLLGPPLDCPHLGNTTEWSKHHWGRAQLHSLYSGVTSRPRQGGNYLTGEGLAWWPLTYGETVTCCLRCLQLKQIWIFFFALGKIHHLHQVFFNFFVERAYSLEKNIDFVPRLGNYHRTFQRKLGILHTSDRTADIFERFVGQGFNVMFLWSPSACGHLHDLINFMF